MLGRHDLLGGDPAALVLDRRHVEVVGRRRIVRVGIAQLRVRRRPVGGHRLQPRLTVRLGHPVFSGRYRARTEVRRN
jgi:hypothetical protein